eukprot:CAMPEP_0184859160 /NCGR_PEP_ID=MMETSP0580-20130426/4174_1 /TAXON_ID=1118495 /ORGANISM="Dactyliosolen fragilissimus" /LENGTH=1113 /DNA_ID=CAMNT_0027355635 /DNA_START=298 /DNA_END=3639 /DNA_ORIENTATION=-
MTDRPLHASYDVLSHPTNFVEQCRKMSVEPCATSGRTRSSTNTSTGTNMIDGKGNWNNKIERSQIRRARNEYSIPYRSRCFATSDNYRSASLLLFLMSSSSILSLSFAFSPHSIQPSNGIHQLLASGQDVKRNGARIVPSVLHPPRPLYKAPSPSYTSSLHMSTTSETDELSTKDTTLSKVNDIKNTKKENNANKKTFDDRNINNTTRSKTGASMLKNERARATMTKPSKSSMLTPSTQLLRSLPQQQQQQQQRERGRRKKKYKRKRDKTPTEKERDRIRQIRQEKYDLLREQCRKERRDEKMTNDNNKFDNEDTQRKNLYNSIDKSGDKNKNEDKIKGIDDTSDQDGGYDVVGLNLWSFESLFPEPVWDERTIFRDLYEVKKRDEKNKNGSLDIAAGNVDDDNILVNKTRDNLNANRTQTISDNQKGMVAKELKKSIAANNSTTIHVEKLQVQRNRDLLSNYSLGSTRKEESDKQSERGTGDSKALDQQGKTKVDRTLTRMVEDKLYGYRRGTSGEFQYDTSLMGDGAVKFRDGIRLGNALKVNADRLNYFAKREFNKGRLEEAEELYEKAIGIDPKDGRGYLGLSRVAQRRRDFRYARECLRVGLARSVSDTIMTTTIMTSPSSSSTTSTSISIESDSTKSTKDSNNRSSNNSNSSTKNNNNNQNSFTPTKMGRNPYILQALGCLEERCGHLAEAEAAFIAACRSRPSHAAAWVSLAQLRTRKLRRGAASGRSCYQTAERELRLAGLPPSAHVYTAWAALEYNDANDPRRARELFLKALDIDPRCSAAWLQLGSMESKRDNWDEARRCFEEVLTYDQRNSRVLQAYALMESRKPGGDGRVAIELFERALKMRPRDGGVLQAYALYVAELGDIDGARNLLKRGTELDKRHAPLWQAWGVLEFRHGTPSRARDVFQQGIWACAQSSGGQSGGRRCARLWQAWGVLEAREGDHAAARRCFSRALDADNHNVAAVTAWTSMEAELGNYVDARHLFERALKQFLTSTDEKMALWRAYELMETKGGNDDAAQSVYSRSIRDAMVTDDYFTETNKMPSTKTNNNKSIPAMNNVLKKSEEVEVSSWRSSRESSFGGNEVWMNDGSIEGRVPFSYMNKKK